MKSRGLNLALNDLNLTFSLIDCYKAHGAFSDVAEHIRHVDKLLAKTQPSLHPCNALLVGKLVESLHLQELSRFEHHGEHRPKAVAYLQLGVDFSLGFDCIEKFFTI